MGKDAPEWQAELNQCRLISRVVAVKRKSGLSMDTCEARGI